MTSYPRRIDLPSRDVGSGLVVLHDDRVVSLDETRSALWVACTGLRSIEQLAHDLGRPVASVEADVHDLAEIGLVQAGGTTRRSVLRGAGLAGGVVVAGGVSSVLLPMASASASVPVQNPMNFTTPTNKATPFTYTVPAGVTSLTVTVAGGGGGVGFASPAGGAGLKQEGTLAVVPGSVLRVYVGGSGSQGPSGSLQPGGVGFTHGGAVGSVGGRQAGSGGGSSAITDTNDVPFVVAAGGGGAGPGGFFTGGAGGDAGAAGGAGTNGTGGAPGTPGTRTDGGGGGFPGGGGGGYGGGSAGTGSNPNGGGGGGGGGASFITGPGFVPGAASSNPERTDGYVTISFTAV